MGGTDDQTNLIKLTIQEHAEAHRLLFEKHRNKFDQIAYLVLSKQIGQEEANYMKLLGPKNWTPEGKEKLKKLGKERTGEKNGFFGKKHSEEAKQKNRESHTGDNSWIKGIDPSLLPYTKQYTIQYPNGDIKQVSGLKKIAEEFKVSIPNAHSTIKRMTKGSMPKRGAFVGVIIQEMAI